MMHLLPSLALAGAVVLAYGNSLGGVFQFDDFNVIVGNPAVHSWQAWLADAPTGIRPLLKFSYLLNWTWGAGTFGFHLLNILIQAINAILIYHLSRKFLEDLASPSPKAAALASALIFALHPVQTEAVAYISGRSTSLMALFYLGSLLAYAHGRGRDNRRLLYLASPLLFIMAVLTKETAVTLPLALLLWDRTSAPKDPWKNTLRNLGIHSGMLGIMAVVLAVHRGYLKFFEACFQTRGWEENLSIQINALPHLFSRLFFLRSLNIDPDLPLVSAWNPLVLLQALLLAALISLGLICLRRRPSLGFGLLWFFIHLLPTNSVIPRLDITNDRQLYLASWGIFLVFSTELERIAENLKPGRLLPVAATALLAFTLGLATMSRNEVYKSEVALWEDTAQKSPHKARVHNNLGVAYYLSGRYGDAERSYLTALGLKPDDSLARNNLTFLENLLAKKG